MALSKQEFLRILPDEVWSNVLQTLANEEDSEESLLHCALFDDLWKGLIEKLSPKPFWNPWWIHSSFRCKPGTMFKDEFDLKMFRFGLSNLSQEDREKNPFRNHTVIINWSDTSSATDLNEKALKIVKQYGRHIRMFIYTLAVKGNKLPDFLSHMPNLQTLILNPILCAQMDLSSFQTFGFSKNTGIQELVLSGYCDWHPAKFSSSWGVQMKSLTISFNSRINVLELFPNLENLRVDFNWFFPGYLPYEFLGGYTSLRKLSIKTRNREQSENFSTLLRFVRKSSESLELLSFNFEPERNGENKEQNVNNGAQPIRFPKMAKLILPGWFLRAVNPLTIETRLNMELPGLKSVTFEDIEGVFENRNLREDEVQQLCEPFWELVPPSVQTVAIRSMKRVVQFGRDFPVLFECHRRPTT